MIKAPRHVNEFIARFKKEGHQIYVVGGAVRDLLLARLPDGQGKSVINWDFATDATPEVVQKLFPDSFYNNQFGTVGVKTKEGVMEVTTFRKEEDYQDARHPEKIEWAKTIEEDLSRRDFTINAIAYDGEKIVDPYSGQKDLKDKLIRAVGDPDKRFAEDALRLMRAVRLASELGFVIEKKTGESIKTSSESITKISVERIREELMRIMASPNPAEGILFMRNTGLLHYILPEVDDCFGVEQVSPMRHHIYDVGTHLVESLRHCPSTDPITRLATLLHDIGKKQTYHKEEKTGLITFHNHEVVGTKQAEKIVDRLRLSKKEKDKLVTLVKHHQFTVSELQTDKAIRRFIRNVGHEYLQDMLNLRTGDRIGGGATPTSWRLDLFKKRLQEVQQEPFSVKDLKIDGNVVMKTLKLKPGPKVGEILKKLFEEVTEGKLKNEKKELIAKLKKITKTT